MFWKAFFFAVVCATQAVAQTSPNWSYGQVPTAAQWNAAFASKQDVLGYRAINQIGDTMLGPLVFMSSSAARAPIRVPPGTAPSAPANGDLWVTSSGAFMRAASSNFQFLMMNATCDGVVSYSSTSGATCVVPNISEIAGLGTGVATALAHDTGAAGGVIVADSTGKAPAAQTVAMYAFRNLIRNADFRINQRAVSGTVTLAAGEYGHDGVKAGAAGATYTFNQVGLDVTLTVSAGSIILPIESNLVVAGVYRLSQSGTAQARVWQGTGYTGSGTYAAAPFTTTSLGANTQTNVEFSTGTVLLPQLEVGSIETTFDRRPYVEELAICQRYYYRRTASTTSDVIGHILAYDSSHAWGKLFDLPVEMRAGNGAVSVSDPSHFQVYNATLTANVALTSFSTLAASTRSVVASGGMTVTGLSGMAAGQSLAITFNTTDGWIAVSSEL